MIVQVQLEKTESDKKEERYSLIQMEANGIFVELALSEADKFSPEEIVYFFQHFLFELKLNPEKPSYKRTQ